MPSTNDATSCPILLTPTRAISWPLLDTFTATTPPTARTRLRRSARHAITGLQICILEPSDVQRIQTMAPKTRLYVPDNRSGHLKVYLGIRQTVMPYHPNKEMKKGTAEAIKKQLGLK